MSTDDMNVGLWLVGPVYDGFERENTPLRVLEETVGEHGKYNQYAEIPLQLLNVERW